MSQLSDVDADLALPPPELRKRVTGTADESLFLTAGAQILRDVRRVFAGVHRSLGAPGTTTLDFGCGCGRVLRHFGPQPSESAKLYGVDIDPHAVTWCAEHLGNLGQFATVDRHPPLPFPDDYFHAVYSVSVFTHLTEDDQLAWLPELRRVTAADGVVVLTVLGRTALSALGPGIAERTAAAGVYYVHDGGTEGLPDWYQTCFHTEEYIRRVWSREFEIVSYLDGAVCRSQDAVVLRPRA
ncbi:MAG TPA: class I SAM-dependent methyltransferase [Pilimelia sp.]|nr:class I SAM-dependent methyltransferase [Pilimelia sp.]